MDGNDTHHRTHSTASGRRRTPGAAGRAIIMACAAGVAVLAFTAAGSAATSAPAAPAGSTASPSVPKCRAANLGVWVAADQGNGAAGTIYYPLEFTNLSRRTCSLYGFPGVSAIDRHGHQLGSPAFRDHTVAPHTVRLAPGATAHATLMYSDVIVGSCPTHTRPAFELRIFPPDQTSATHAYWDLDVCTAKQFLGIRAIQAGAGKS